MANYSAQYIADQEGGARPSSRGTPPLAPLGRAAAAASRRRSFSARFRWLSMTLLCPLLLRWTIHSASDIKTFWHVEHLRAWNSGLPDPLPLLARTDSARLERLLGSGRQPFLKKASAICSLGFDTISIHRSRSVQSMRNSLSNEEAFARRSARLRYTRFVYDSIPLDSCCHHARP